MFPKPSIKHDFAALGYVRDWDYYVKYNVENNYKYVIIYGLYSAVTTIEYGMDQ